MIEIRAPLLQCSNVCLIATARASRSSRLQTAKGGDAKAQNEGWSSLRAIVQGSTQSSFYVKTLRRGPKQRKRARVFGAVDRQARSHFGAACVVCGTNGRPRVAFDAGVAARATKRLPRAARGDTRAAQLTDSTSPVRRPAPSVDAVSVHGCCSTRVLPVKGCPTRWLRRRY